MSENIIHQTDNFRKQQAIAMILAGQVSPNGQPNTVFVQTDDSLYAATATACTCSDAPCPHTLAADIYLRARRTIEQMIERWAPASLPQIARAIEDDLRGRVTDPDMATKCEICLAICRQMYHEALDAGCSIAQNQQRQKQNLDQARRRFIQAVEAGAEGYEAHLPDFYRWLAKNNPSLLEAMQATWPSTFYSVAAGPGGVMFCPVPQRKERRMKR